MLREGITYVHEHITIDLSGVKENDDCNLNSFEATVEEFKILYNLGVRNVVDVTNIGMHRNPHYVEQVAQATGINIIHSTGWYQDRFLPPYIETTDINDLADQLIADITVGMDNTQIKANVIGEIGTSRDRITEREEKVFIASIIAAKETGVVLSTHCTLGRLGLEQVQLMKSHHFDCQKAVIGHVDLSGDIHYILQLLDQGVYVSFDTIGKENYLPDLKRVAMIKQIIHAGFIDKLMLSMDITRKSHLKHYGGTGYSFLLTDFVPLMREHGVEQEHIDRMLIQNPMNFFTRSNNQ
ncbi:TatD family hydrolase (plasmid) [Entomospira entomophila]|uniref:Phosphotriesterase-related protein n=1 Tax=Entomospira entomophila TaxID=2719988 RepID=A0A968KS26_9SPIO|nr:TatD family hydrolase [Entomospira entomophilus]NIZ41309.1 phosphotriesterase-related protein [Entomospira entomophilus]WDI36168.1 TatD family hydrolase [Entomospira entomophilus]